MTGTNLSLLRRELSEYLGKTVSDEALTPLASGYSGAINYRLKLDGRDYFIRTFPGYLGIDARKAEVDASQLAARNGIAPITHYYSEDYTWLVTDYISGKHMEWSDYQDMNTLERLIDKLKALHSIQVSEIRRAPTTLEKFRFYLQATLEAHATIPGELIKLENNLFAIEHPCETPCFIHNDLNPFNILLKGDAFFFIDWTDAGIGDPCYDLVEIAVFLPPEQHIALLEYYQPNFTKRDANQLERHWLQRIGLFSAWAYQQAAKLNPSIDTKEWQQAIQAPKIPLTDLLRRILTHEIQLDGEQNFIQFSAICYQNVSDYISEHYQ